MMWRLITVGATLGLAFGVIGSGAAVAQGTQPTVLRTPKPPTIATGTTTCNYQGVLVADAIGKVAIRGNLTPNHIPACTSKGGTKLRTGHLSDLGSAETITGGLCSLLPGGSIPDLADGTIRWSPTGIASTTGVALTGGSVSLLTAGSDTFLLVAYTDGSVAGGSFTNPSGGWFAATSRQTVAELTEECADGPVDAIALTGQLTL